MKVIEGNVLMFRVFEGFGEFLRVYLGFFLRFIFIEYVLNFIGER